MITVGFFALLALLAAAVWYAPAWPARARARAAERAFPEHWQRLLEAELPLYRHLPLAQQTRLKGRILTFLHGRHFIGCGGLQVSEDMRVLIAAQACVLALGETVDPWPGLTNILLYPDVFLSPQVVTHDDGVVEESLRELEGESWDAERVVLAWQEVRFGAADPHDGVNVVIHEFAHQLDHASEGEGGLPDLPTSIALNDWTAVWGAAYAEAVKAVAAGRETWFDPAAVELPGEFFAYLVEHFIETPDLLHAEWPRVYQLLTQLFAIDPLGWQCPEEA